MANTNEKMNRRDKIQIAFIVVILIVICVMIVAIITLAKYAEEIKSNAIDYAIKNTNIQGCTCYDDQGRQAFFGENQVNNLDDIFVKT